MRVDRAAGRGARRRCNLRKEQQESAPPSSRAQSRSASAVLVQAICPCAHSLAVGAKRAKDFWASTRLAECPGEALARGQMRSEANFEDRVQRIAALF